MKRLLVVLVTLMAALSVSAQGRFGVTAGMNFNSAKIKDIKTDVRTGWNVGVTYALDLPLGFSVQPAFVYSQKVAGFSVDMGLVPGDPWSSHISSLKADFTQIVGSLNLPVSLQWGPDLIVARPFIDVTPFVGYSVMNKVKAEVAGIVEEVKGDNAFEYGLGLGAGINVWRLQAIVRYNWNFGVMGSLKDFTDIDLGDLNTEDPAYGGLTVSVAFFF